MKERVKNMSDKTANDRIKDALVYASGCIIGMCRNNPSFEEQARPHYDLIQVMIEEADKNIKNERTKA
jgi:hypothetical protein